MLSKLVATSLALSIGSIVAIRLVVAADSHQIYLPLVTTHRSESSGATASPIPEATTASAATEAATDALHATPSPQTPTAAPATDGDVVLITLGDPIAVDGSGAVVSDSTVTVVDGGTYRVVGELSDGMIQVDTQGSVELQLAGMRLANADGPAIYVVDASQVSVVLVSDTQNALRDGADYIDPVAKGTLFSNDSLVLSGDGALTISGSYQHGIASDDDLLIQGGNISIEAATDGLHANDNISVTGGTITVTGANDGIESEGDFVQDGGNLELTVADDGVVSQGPLTVNGGTIEVYAGFEGIESKDCIVINDGDISIEVTDDGINAAHDVTINGGRIFVDARADAVDSNGTLSINGGVIVGLGGNRPEGGLDCDRCSIAINGGVVVATGGENSSPATTSAQHVAVIGGMDVGSVLHIEQGTSDTLTFRVTKAYQSMIFTSPLLTADSEYTIYEGGTVEGGDEFHGLYTGAGYNGGSIWATFTTDETVTYIGVTQDRPRPPGRP